MWDGCHDGPIEHPLKKKNRKLYMNRSKTKKTFKNAVDLKNFQKYFFKLFSFKYSPLPLLLGLSFFFQHFFLFTDFSTFFYFILFLIFYLFSFFFNNFFVLYCFHLFFYCLHLFFFSMFFAQYFFLLRLIFFQINNYKLNIFNCC
jgi:hypothetical protein